MNILVVNSDMTVNTLLLFSIFTVFSWCSGQSQKLVDQTNERNTTIGDTVSEFDKSIFIIFQAQNNIYWFGSNGQGVYRYDPSASPGAGGKSILHFTTKDGLSNDTIREIQEDKSGNIFFTTHNGISKFDGQKITTLAVDKTKTTEWKSEPGDLWFKGEPGKNGPYRYDGKNLYHLEFPKHYMADEVNASIPNQRYSPYEVYFIYNDHKGNVWFGTSNFGICRYDARLNDSVGQGKSLSWMYEDHLQFVAGGGSFGIRSIIEDKEGKFWFCNSRYRYNVYPDDSIGKTHRFIRYKREKGIDLKTPNGDELIYYMSVIEDNNGDLWMATYNSGVWRYDPSASPGTGGKNITHYPVKDGEKDITLFSIYKDNHGDLWLGTHEAGAYKFNGKTFEKFRP